MTAASYSIHTRAENPSDTPEMWLATSRSTFHFKVKSCQEAIIRLNGNPTSNPDDAAEVIIGSNSNQEVRIIPHLSNMDQDKTVATRNVLDCDSHREFWISWEDSVIRVGHGQPYEVEILSETHAISEITSFTLASGDLHDGYWELSKTEGM